MRAGISAAMQTELANFAAADRFGGRDSDLVPAQTFSALFRRGLIDNWHGSYRLTPKGWAVVRELGLDASGGKS